MADKKNFSRSQAIEAVASGKELAELRGLNSATIDFIYAFSALHYQNGNYDDAVIGFKFLCRHKHRDADMWLALARALFAQGKKMEAIKAYLMVAVLRPSATLCLEIARIFFVEGDNFNAKTFIDAAKRALLPNSPTELKRDIQQLEKEVLAL